MDKMNFTISNLSLTEFNDTNFYIHFIQNRSNVSILTNRSRPLDIVSYSSTQAIFYILYVTIFLLGVFGNCLVCYVVFRNKHMQTVTNYFITNLALADILLCVLAVPFTPLYFFMGEWVFGSVLCHLLSWSQGVSVYVSTLTLTSIAIDRFFVIIYPFRPRLRLQVCYLIIVCIWIFSLSATLPYALYIGQVKYEGRYYCEEFWPSELIRRIFSVFTAVMQFVIPFIIILICYDKISIRMNERAKSKPGSKSSKKDEIERERKRRTNRMLIAMVTIFGVSWLPMNVIHLVGDYYVYAGRWAYYNLCFFISHVVAMSSTCYNPFLYAWLNENFRKEFQLVLPCFEQSAATIINRGQWRSERTCNGNNETQQEMLNQTPIATVAGSKFRYGASEIGKQPTVEEEPTALPSISEAHAMITFTDSTLKGNNHFEFKSLCEDSNGQCTETF